jgi:proteasome lid subunit RPN8/RPN11
MSTLGNVSRIRVPRNVIDATHAHLHAVGLYGCEGWVFWAGTVVDNLAVIAAAYVPEQKAYKSEGGVCVVVEAPALHKLNIWLYQNRLELIAQVHSHPGRAYHSDTDDRFPIATTIGAFSIVVPNFARDPIAIGNCAVYRLEKSSLWTEMSRQSVEVMVEVEN